jgi:hypothetical protein
MESKRILVDYDSLVNEISSVLRALTLGAHTLSGLV